MKLKYIRIVLLISGLIAVIIAWLIQPDTNGIEAQMAEENRLLIINYTLPIEKHGYEALSAYEDDFEAISLGDILAGLISYAQRRFDNAAPCGTVIRTGRHYPADIEALEAAIENAVKAAAQNPSDEDIENIIQSLSSAVYDFNNSIIDPYNRYRPFLHTIAVGEDIPQKRHLRAAWIATVINIDWPSVSSRGTTPLHIDGQMRELRNRFDEMAYLGFNAVIFQISPTGDAFYNSELVPWSAWLTGETNFTGRLLDSRGNEFDPLAYAIELAREHNMEFHAWFNPYRITHSLVSYTRANNPIILSQTGRPVESLAEIRSEWADLPGNPFNTMGEYIALGEGRYVLDPGVPAARQWIVQRVMEVVKNYDIDAVHFDDYFYPSGWNDDLAFARYNTAENNWISGIKHADTAAGRANWRRENTEMLIREVNEAIKEAAPWVQFGISPGGVWISGDGSVGLDGGGVTDDTGSASTTSWSNYHSSFADTRRWVIENFIDYITPQIYWDWSLPAAPYGPIADWWGRLVQNYGPDGNLRNSQGEYTNTRLYNGLGLYRMAGNPPLKWSNAYEHDYEGKRTFLRQEHYNLGNPNISGSMIFSHNHIRPREDGGLWKTMTALRNNAWRYPALVPAITHLGGIAPAAPDVISIVDNTLTWRNAELSTEPLSAVRYFVVYRSLQFPVDTSNPANIFAIVPAGQNDGVYSLELYEVNGYYFAVTAVNRLHMESPASVYQAETRP